ncbi:MAG: 5-amino-6-(D-ribitylamino)uracil--L-tyrosine 4-hydroxyphenyl transferase CofH [Afipia sp.]|nr:5-amino-6-(D-ribitylamino)uracil--L-tyrosine 4-hydroxyphenyl transferase CofH [Afipia sp.]
MGYGEKADTLLAEVDGISFDELLLQARSSRERGHGKIVSYSNKVFVPLTRLCRDHCSYCTFAASPRKLKSLYLSPDEVMEICRAGEAAGSREALFTLGDKPELRYRAAREALKAFGYSSTVEYLIAMCELVLRKTKLLPHINAGVMSEEEIDALRTVSVSQGIMLESISERLCDRGGPHFGSPDKRPEVRLEMIRAAGRRSVPFTTGILIGIGETRRERLASLIALRNIHEEFGHIQEIIVQNFRAKPKTRMAANAEPDFDDLLWTAAVARKIFGPEMNIQVPPNLSYDGFGQLLQAGINDWGGISPVTPDHVNPEAPWPEIVKLRQATLQAGLYLVPRLAAYPRFVTESERWMAPKVRTAALKASDASGFERNDIWVPGVQKAPPAKQCKATYSKSAVDKVLSMAFARKSLSEQQINALFLARDAEVQDIAMAADELRKQESGSIVRYVVNRNINYTNICTFKCGFCAFSKGKTSEHLRGRPYDLSLTEIVRRAREAWERGATEVCMQGGISPSYTGNTYLDLLRAVKAEVPNLHVHAFSPLEVTHGAKTLGISIVSFLRKLRDEGLGSLPGTAAEILDDDIRAIICPDKLTTHAWLNVIREAHQAGLQTTATIMFGHVEQPYHWAKHLSAIRDLQNMTGGFTEFVPLPFVHMESPLYLRGGTRRGPTWREVELMHAVARIALHPAIPNIQASWVKLGQIGVSNLLNAGVNDLGGTLMNESISRAAGTEHGQELEPHMMESLITSAGRVPQQRTTLYADATAERRYRSFRAIALSEVVQTPPSPRQHALL